MSGCPADGVTEGLTLLRSSGSNTPVCVHYLKTHFDGQTFLKTPELTRIQKQHIFDIPTARAQTLYYVVCSFILYRFVLFSETDNCTFSH